jgi:hypothetical protein
MRQAISFTNMKMSFSSSPLHGLGSSACTGTHLFLGMSPLFKSQKYKILSVKVSVV